MMETEQNKIYDLIREEFTDTDVLDTALYVLSTQAVAEATQYAVMTGKASVENLPPQALEVIYKYESGLIKNEFFLKHYTLLRAFVVMDRLKVETTGKLSALAGKSEERDIYKALYHLFYSKLDSLVMIAFLWKGYDYAAEFMTKLKVVTEIPKALEEHCKSRME